MLRVWTIWAGRLRRGLMLAVCAALPGHAAEITDTAFSDARFEEATAVVLGAKGAQVPPKAAMLWVYQSRLGSILKTRDPEP